MSDLDDIKAAANPYTQLTEATKEHSGKTDTVIKLLGALCDSVDINTNINADILKKNNSNHDVWVKVSKHRRYINIAAVLVTGAILWLDVLKLNPNSEIVDSAVNIAKAIAGLLL